MSYSISATIGEIVKKNISEDKTAAEITEFLSKYKKGTWLYPGVLKRKFNVQISDVYNLLLELESVNLLESYYELSCGNCQKTTGDLVRVLNDIPETFECELCGEELSGIENALMIFKVIADE